MKNYIHKGKEITVSAPYDLESGELVIIADLVGVAIVDALEGAEVTISTQGVYEFPKDSSEVLQGHRAYYDQGSKTVGRQILNEEEAEGEPITPAHKPIGIFVEAASEEAKIARVKIA